MKHHKNLFRVTAALWLLGGVLAFAALWYPPGSGVWARAEARDRLAEIKAAYEKAADGRARADSEEWSNIITLAEDLVKASPADMETRCLAAMWQARALCKSGKVDTADDLLENLKEELEKTPAAGPWRDQVGEQYAVTKHFAAWCVLQDGGDAAQWRVHTRKAMDELHGLARRAARDLHAPVPLPVLLRQLAIVTKMHRTRDPRSLGMAFPTCGEPSPDCRKRYQEREMRKPPPSQSTPPPTGNESEAERAKNKLRNGSGG